MSKANQIPEGVTVVTPMLVCRNPPAELEFCKLTFNAVELVRRPGPVGTVAHALVRLGPAMVMIEGEWPTLASRAPQPDGSSPVVIFIYVEDVDKVVEREERWSKIVKG
jgi:PhnB protein